MAIEDHELTPVQGLETEGAEIKPFAEVSIMDMLQAEAKELAESKEAYIPVKGYERTGLQVCYRMPENGKLLSEIARRVRREVKDDYTRNLTIALDVMANLCEGLYVQPEGVDEPQPLDLDHTGTACRFDSRLANMLGMNDEVASARQVILKLFGNNEMMVLTHSEKLNRWLSNAKADLSLELWQSGE